MVLKQEWFTVDEVAGYLRVSKRTIYRLCQEGELVGYRTSRRGYWRFRKEDPDNALKRGMPEDEMEGLVALTATADPVLAEIWDNEKDEAYDRVLPGRRSPCQFCLSRRDRGEAPPRGDSQLRSLPSRPK